MPNKLQKCTVCGERAKGMLNSITINTNLTANCLKVIIENKLNI